MRQESCQNKNGKGICNLGYACDACPLSKPALTENNRLKTDKCLNCGEPIYSGSYCMKQDCRNAYLRSWYRLKQEKDGIKVRDFGKCLNCGATLKSPGKYCSKKGCKMAYLGGYIKNKYNTDPRFKKKWKKMQAKRKREKTAELHEKLDLRCANCGTRLHRLGTKYCIKAKCQKKSREEWEKRTKKRVNTPRK